MLSNLTHEMIREACSPFVSEEKKVQVWKSYIDRLFQIDCERERAASTFTEDAAHEKKEENKIHSLD